MKRSGPPKRKTPLRADPAQTRDWQDRSRRRLPPTGRKAKREQSELDTFRAEVKARAQGWCEAQTVGALTTTMAVEVCGTSFRHPGRHCHHVWPEDRDRGVHDPDRGLFLCAAAHGWAHTHPEQAAMLGLLRPR